MDERGGNDTRVHCDKGPRPAHHLYRGDCGSPNAPFKDYRVAVLVSKAAIMPLVP